MKLTFLPTLTDLREMLGDKLYVEFVWMWREQEQNTRSQERRAKLGELAPARTTQAWPQPLYARAPSPELASIADGKPAAQVAVLHPGIQRLLEKKVNEPDWLARTPGNTQDDEPETVTARFRSAAE